MTCQELGEGTGGIDQPGYDGGLKASSADDVPLIQLGSSEKKLWKKK